MLAVRSFHCSSCRRDWCTGFCWACADAADDLATSAKAVKRERRKQRKLEDAQRKAEEEEMLRQAIEQSEVEHKRLKLEAEKRRLNTIQELLRALDFGNDPSAQLRFTDAFTKFLVSDAEFFYAFGFLFVKYDENIRGYPMSVNQMRRLFKRTGLRPVECGH